MYRESIMEIYISICKTDSQWEFAVWEEKRNLAVMAPTTKSHQQI